MTPTSAPIRSLLFVCMGNICRSPAGENVMRQRLKDAGLDHLASCDSAGTIAYHAGDAPDARMSAAAHRRGFRLTGRARRIVKEDLERFDLVIAMDDQNLRDLKAMAHEGNRHKIVRFCDFCEKHDATEVPDPYYGGTQGFEFVLDLIEDGCAQLVELVRKSHQA